MYTEGFSVAEDRLLVLVDELAPLVESLRDDALEVDASTSISS